MATLSKEEFKLLLSNSVASPDLDKVQDAIADLVAENGLTKLALSQKIELLKSCEQALGKSYAENERLKEMVSIANKGKKENLTECLQLTDQLPATRTALAAATEIDYFRVQKVADYYLIDYNKLSAAINAYLTRSLD